MQNEVEDINKMSTITMYKMIQALHKYDYYSTKCFVNVLIQKRQDEQEIKTLNKIQEMLFYQRSQELTDMLEDLTNPKMYQ